MRITDVLLLAQLLENFLVISLCFLIFKDRSFAIFTILHLFLNIEKIGLENVLKEGKSTNEIAGYLFDQIGEFLVPRALQVLIIQKLRHQLEMLRQNYGLFP